MPEKFDLDSLSVDPKIMAKNQALLSWEAANFDRKDKDLRWYSIAAVFVVVMVGVFIWTRDWFPILITVVIAAVLFWYLKSSKQKRVSYQITPLGILADDRFYPFSEIHSFWLVYNEKVQKIYIAFIKKYLPALVIGLGGVDPVKLRAILLEKIPEQEKRGENFLDRLVRILGL